MAGRRPPTHRAHHGMEGGEWAQQETTVKLHIGEAGFCSDLEHTAKYEAKAAHYAPLIEELTTAGWNVHHTTHALTIGVRAT
eukprot:2531788-Pyramimonas_sp.AAC.1